MLRIVIIALIVCCCGFALGQGDLHYEYENLRECRSTDIQSALQSRAESIAESFTNWFDEAQPYFPDILHSDMETGWSLYEEFAELELPPCKDAVKYHYHLENWMLYQLALMELGRNALNNVEYRRLDFGFIADKLTETSRTELAMAYDGWNVLRVASGSSALDPASRECIVDIANSNPDGVDGIELIWSAPESITGEIITSNGDAVTMTASEEVPSIAVEVGHVGYVKTYLDVPTGAYKLRIEDAFSDYSYEKQFVHSVFQFQTVAFRC